MNKYLRKLGFRNSDDMEMKITIKAIKWSWIYMMAFLAIWSILSAIDNEKIPMVQIALILTGELLYFSLQWVFTKKAIREDQENHSDSRRISHDNKKRSYEYVHEGENDVDYVYEEVEVEVEE